MSWEDKVREAHKRFEKTLDVIELDDDIDVGPAWAGIIGEREVRKIFNTDFGLGDMSVSLIAFQDGSFEVGVGEALRPYDELYRGNDANEATEAYVSFIDDHTWSEEDESFNIRC